jgi:hypothetical protein
MNSTTQNTNTTITQENKGIIRIPGWFNVRKDAKIYPITEFPFRQRPRANAYVSDTESDSDDETE